MRRAQLAKKCYYPLHAKTEIEIEMKMLLFIAGVDVFPYK